jgi:hypothetical protein
MLDIQYSGQHQACVTAVPSLNTPCIPPAKSHVYCRKSSTVGLQKSNNTVEHLRGKGIRRHNRWNCMRMSHRHGSVRCNHTPAKSDFTFSNITILKLLKPTNETHLCRLRSAANVGVNSDSCNAVIVHPEFAASANRHLFLATSKFIRQTSLMHKAPAVAAQANAIVVVRLNRLVTQRALRCCSCAKSGVVP